jgi:4-hydroxybenzoate polyprenyltransferase
VNRTVRAYLELVRLPNLFTAMADPMGGYLFVGGDSSRVGVLAALCMASLCLYAAGTALNDACDAERDARERPERPIPSGRITRSAAIRLSAALMIAGSGIALAISPACGLVTVILCTAICLYDGPLKSTRAAAVMMGTCRALNLSIGIIAAEPAPDVTTAASSAAGCIGLYVASVTIFARDETRCGGRGRLIVGASGASTAAIGVMVLALLTAPISSGVVAFSTAALALAGIAGGGAIRTASARDIQRGVRLLIVNIIFLDASLAATGSGFLSGLLVGLLAVPTVILGNWFPKT